MHARRGLLLAAAKRAGLLQGSSRVTGDHAPAVARTHPLLGPVADHAGGQHAEDKAPPDGGVEVVEMEVLRKLMVTTMIQVVMTPTDHAHY